jgi:hypothetical protein
MQYTHALSDAVNTDERTLRGISLAMYCWLVVRTTDGELYVTHLVRDFLFDCRWGATSISWA